MKWISLLQIEIKSNHKSLDNLEVKARGLNLILDGLSEVPNEDTLVYVGNFLAKFVPLFNRGMMDVAYRLGSPQKNKPLPRRILLHTTSFFARNLILECAEQIAGAGLPGARVFVSEDLPESIRRKRQDMFKYVNFLKEKGIKASQKGDGVMFNGTLYKYEEILNMPEGFSLKNSRTKTLNGVTAFQSQFSPLSNLFVAPIRRNGITYRSSEHAFQHAKALCNDDHAIARSVLDEPCPYEAMALGKKIPITSEWQSKQLIVMEEILRLKLEQVPQFVQELKSTGNQHLVENARSPFWGAGTHYNALSIFNKTYPGRNHMGRLLVKVRDHF